MCGIVGIHNLTCVQPIREGMLRQMLGMIRHRGPDQFGVYLDDQVGLGNARLSIVDLSSGQQPIANEDESLWIVFNGEIFNHTELRRSLEARGHRFATHCDTEVLLHLYEEYGPECLAQLNGQFAFVIWDTRAQTLFLARDRLGVRPLFYTLASGALIFGSEIKALLVDPRVRAEIDPLALDQVFSFWSALSPRTIFRDIVELPPGHTMVVHAGQITITPYWQPEFPFSDDAGFERPESEYLEELRELLVDATRIRLRADVPVGAYLSGGLDSSTIAAIIRNHSGSHLDTFSVAFDDPGFDESAYQREMAEHLGTQHQVVYVTHADIAQIFPEVIWHTETPILRTSPAAMFLLSKLARDRNYKVVLTGEGADEFLAGYDIFKEAEVRRFWAKQPESHLRPLLFKRLYPWLGSLSSNSGASLSAFFREGLCDVEAPDYSHAPRWRTTRRARRFFSDELRHAIDAHPVLPERNLRFPENFQRWEHLQQAQYLEIATFLSPYLLSSQGDRMGMAHAVEGRYPFLDHRVVAFCNRLPTRLKLRGLTEKYLLKQLSRTWLPEKIWSRPKQPFRAPIHRSFFQGAGLQYVQELLSPERIQADGLFKAVAVSQLRRKLEQGLPLGETDDMALVGILSTQLVVSQFIHAFQRSPAISEHDNVKVCVRTYMVGG